MDRRTIGRRRAAGLVLIAALGACQLGQDGSTSPTASPPSSSPAAEIDCPTIDLRSPTGSAVNLNGTWETEKEGARGGIYYVRQVGSCVWFAGGFPAADETDVPGALGYVTVIFRGTVGADFVVVGEWIDAREQFVDNPGPGGTVRLNVQFASDGQPRLVYVEGEGQPFVEPGIREEQSWVRISDGGAYPPP